MARSSNFGFPAQHDVQLERLGALAERFFAEDANTSIIKTGQFAELLAQLTAAKLVMWTSAEERAARAEAERQSWERLAQGADADRARLEAELTTAQAQATSEPPERAA